MSADDSRFSAGPPAPCSPLPYVCAQEQLPCFCNALQLFFREGGPDALRPRPSSGALILQALLYPALGRAVASPASQKSSCSAQKAPPSDGLPTYALSLLRCLRVVVPPRGRRAEARENKACGVDDERGLKQAPEEGRGGRVWSGSRGGAGVPSRGLANGDLAAQMDEDDFKPAPGRTRTAATRSTDRPPATEDGASCKHRQEGGTKQQQKKKQKKKAGGEATEAQAREAPC